MFIALGQRRRQMGQIVRQAILETLESRRLMSAVPAPLTSVDVGTPTGGSASQNTSTGEYTVVGAGFDIFGAADAFHYVYQPLTGDGSVVVRVDSDSANGGLSLAGLDIRSSLSTNAANMWVATRDTGAVFVDDRSTDGGTGVLAAPVQSPVAFPVYVKLARSGNSITASTSTDGTNFTTIVTDTINLPSTALVGMAVSSQNSPSTNATATFGGYVVTPASTLSGVVTSANPIDSSTAAPYPFTVTYTDGTGVKASSIGNGNILVTGPGGYSHPATLASTGLTDGPSIAATYNLSPLPTTPGTYTITLLPNQVTNTSGAALAGGTVLGTFTVAGSTNTASILGSVIFADGTIAQGRTVFLDTNNNGRLDPGETSTLSVNTSAFSFTNLAAGTYHVVQLPSAGQQLLDPLSGSATVTVATGETASVPRYVDIAANTQASPTNLQIAFSSKLPTAAKHGKNSKVTVTVTDLGTLPAKKRIKIAVLATTDGTIANKVAALSFAHVTLNPKKTSQTFNIGLKYAKTFAPGSYKLVAVVDPDGVVTETTKLDNTGVSGTVVVS